MDAYYNFSPTTINDAMGKVSLFHDVVVGRIIEPLVPLKCGEYPLRDLEHSANELQEIAAYMLGEFKRTKDARYLRCHLLTEELGELISAMASNDEVLALDALCDLQYVLLGTAVTLDLPLAEGFDEVHTSNMTKRKQADDPDGVRVRQKGEGYVPPRFAEVLSRYRGYTKALAEGGVVHSGPVGPSE